MSRADWHELPISPLVSLNCAHRYFVACEYMITSFQCELRSTTFRNFVCHDVQWQAIDLSDPGGATPFERKFAELIAAQHHILLNEVRLVRVTAMYRRERAMELRT